MIAGRRYPYVARDIGEYIARACFFTSDFARPFERKMDGIALFARKQAAHAHQRGSHFRGSVFRRRSATVTPPRTLMRWRATFAAMRALKVAAARFGQKFLS